MELTSGAKQGLVFIGLIIAAGVVISTLVFPFWNLIREDVYEDVVILTNDNGTCYVDSADGTPKVIEYCSLNPGDEVTIKYGRDLAWATVVSP